jgi:hypothetical protein
VLRERLGLSSVSSSACSIRPGGVGCAADALLERRLPQPVRRRARLAPSNKSQLMPESEQLVAAFQRR